MIGKESGVATKTKELESKTLDTHCHCHSLNSRNAKSTAERCKLLKDTIREICILVKYSPKREKLLGNIRENIEDEQQPTTLDKLCPTRWTVRAACCNKRNFVRFAVQVEGSMHSGKLDCTLDTGYTQLQIICQVLYKRGKCRQSLTNACLKTMESMPSDKSFGMFYELVIKNAESHKMVEEPKTGRKRTKPNYSILQYVDGYDKVEAPDHPVTPKDQFK